VAFILLTSYIRQVPLFTSGGPGLGLENLVLFTSLTNYKITQKQSNVQQSTNTKMLHHGIGLLTPSHIGRRKRSSSALIGHIDWPHCNILVLLIHEFCGQME